jgi:transcriptional regulator with XRE-family HTH domain
MNRIRQAREKAGLSQQALAERAGLSLRAITKIENGGNPRLSTLQAIAKALRLSIADLVPDNGRKRKAS